MNRIRLGQAAHRPLNVTLVVQLCAILEQQQEHSPDPERQKFIRKLRRIRNQLIHAPSTTLTESRDVAEVMDYLQRVDRTTLGTSAAKATRHRMQPDLIASVLRRAHDLQPRGSTPLPLTNPIDRSETAKSPLIKFQLLGPLEVWHEGTRVPLGDQQQRYVLVVLLLHANKPVSTDKLTD
ncbi:hypothetical protein ACFXGA_39785, partial [Actinosynnema sp. NPDC059335]